MTPAEMELLITALLDAMEASLNEKDAIAEVNAKDGTKVIERAMRARDRAFALFGDRLNEYIDQRIQAATGARV